MKITSRLIFAATALTICISGCAKKEIIKGDQEIPAQVVSAPIKMTEEEDKKSDMPPQQQKVAEEKVAVSQELPQKVAEPAADATTVTDTKQTSMITPIFFDFDSYLLSQKSRENLQKNFQEFQRTQHRIIIEGHCDERGSGDYNLALGEERARAAMRYLKALGIPESRMSVISYGKERPADSGHDEAAWQKNRRGEFIVEK